MIAQVPQATRSEELCKQIVQRNIRRFSRFAGICLSDERFKRSADALLPFDKMIGASMLITDEDSPIKKMGIVIMRMDTGESAFSLGISIEFDGTNSSNAPKATIMLAACRSLTALSLWVKKPKFRSVARKYFDEQIDKLALV